MYTLRKRFTFEAAHQLVGHDGKCARLHGHSWVGWVTFRGMELIDDGPKREMLVDYGDVAALIKPIVHDYLDHYNLNASLHVDYPTSEFVAKWVYGKIWEAMQEVAGWPVLDSVTIEETCTSACTYRPGVP